MGITRHRGTMPGGVTQICNSCGVNLCWDISNEDAWQDVAFWNQWKCQDCNGGERMSLEKWRVDNPSVKWLTLPRVQVVRNTGHPWDNRPGFDLLYLDAATKEEMDGFVRKAESRFWQSWLIGSSELTGLPGGVMYKPSGIRTNWIDEPDKPHPGSSSLG